MILKFALLIKKNFIFLSGVFSVLVSLGGTVVSFMKNPYLDEHWPAVSDLGTYSNSMWWFNLAMIFGGIFFFVFWWRYADFKKFDKLEKTFLVLPSIGLTGVGFFPTFINGQFCHVRRIVHWSFAIMFMLGVFWAVLYISYRRIKTFQYRIVTVLSVLFFFLALVIFVLTYSPQHGALITELVLLTYVLLIVVGQIVDTIYEYLPN